MATHSSTLAWKIPWTEECSRLQSMGLQRVLQDLVTEQQQALDVHKVSGVPFVLSDSQPPILWTF